jgi:hypothetical protein
MKISCLSFLTFLAFSTFAQSKIKVETTESYELSNIILALTEYGRTDKWDVQKVSPYYDEVLKYFEPVRDHPLLDSANYSRQEWKKFLGFRTDMYAFSFDKSGTLKRHYPFNSFGPQEVDKNIDLINDFIAKSNYRKFYQDHLAFYKKVVSNYEVFYFLEKSKSFLDNIAKGPKGDLKKNHVVAISPLVGGQNCHRDVDSATTVDFPNVSRDLILGNLNSNIASRIVENHSVFTEMDHGYINPISDNYAGLIAENFDYKKWDKGSGYEGINCFNEYMTWAVYDLFIKEHFPQFADSISLQWQIQNASRGFITQNLFSKKLSELYFSKKGKRMVEDLYLPLLQWCKQVENTVSQPSLVNVDRNSFVKTDLSSLHLQFSETMDTTKTFVAQVFEFKNDKQTGRGQVVEIKPSRWSEDGKELVCRLDTEFEQFRLQFNWWGINKPLLSANGILLQPGSFMLLKK